MRASYAEAHVAECLKGKTQGDGTTTQLGAIGGSYLPSNAPSQVCGAFIAEAYDAEYL